jgi:DNA-binding NtrC family response regulator
MNRILVVDDDAVVRRSLAEALANSATEVRTAEDAERGLAMIDERQPDVVVSDIRMPGLDGLALLRMLRERAPSVDVILMTAYDDMPTVVAAMREGARDFLVKPLDLHELRKVIAHTFEDRRTRERALRAAEEEASTYRLDELVGHDPRMIEIYKLVGQLAANRANVLIRGETRVRALHPGQLHGVRSHAAGVGAVRAREGRLHRRRVRSPWPLRAGRARHDIPRRGRRHVDRVSEQAAAGA